MVWCLVKHRENFTFIAVWLLRYAPRCTAHERKPILDSVLEVKGERYEMGRSLNITTNYPGSVS
jgi:hypothetical protein